MRFFFFFFFCICKFQGNSPSIQKKGGSIDKDLYVSLTVLMILNFIKKNRQFQKEQFTEHVNYCSLFFLQKFAIADLGLDQAFKDCLEMHMRVENGDEKK